VISSKWTRRGGLVLLGALSALAFPPVNLVIVLWICLPLLLNAIDRAENAKIAFGRAWLFGLGHFAAGLYWIACALLVDPWRFGWLIPFAIGGLSAFLALYIAAAAALARCSVAGWPRLLIFAALWAAAEWLRGVVPLGGFPWNPLGSVWSDTLPVLQIVSVIGTFGLSFVTVAAASAPALIVQGRRQGVIASVTGLVAIIAIGVWGHSRLPAAPMPTQPGIQLRLVQASIPQTLKWRPEAQIENFRRQLTLTGQPADVAPTDIVWPESAAPNFLEEEPELLHALASAAPEGGLMLVGAVRGTFEGDHISQLWNSLQAIDRKGAIVGTYDKAHLVPFGEYMPLPKWLPLAKITVGSLDFTPGPGPQTLNLPGLPPVGMLICYEAIFPRAVVDEAHRPDWMLNITNDGWYGVSSGPYQHFAAARMRAIEEGLPLVRNANNGISAVIDPYGQVTAMLGLNAVGTVDAPLPQPLGPTLFSRKGSLMLAVLLLVALGFGLMGNLFRNR
jgi:apolipoprotein N-acyltransferase